MHKIIKIQKILYSGSTFVSEAQVTRPLDFETGLTGETDQKNILK